MIDHPALFRPTNRAVCVELFVDESEAMNLQVTSPGQPWSTLPHAWDTTSAVWLDDHRLMYATSELYGDGGIYVFDFKSSVAAQVVSDANQILGCSRAPSLCRSIPQR